MYETSCNSSRARRQPPCLDIHVLTLLTSSSAANEFLGWSPSQTKAPGVHPYPCPRCSYTYRPMIRKTPENTTLLEKVIPWHHVVLSFDMFPSTCVLAVGAASILPSLQTLTFSPKGVLSSRPAAHRPMSSPIFLLNIPRSLSRFFM